MKLFEGRSGNYFSELIKIEGFTNIQDCLDIINKRFLTEQEIIDYPFYTSDTNDKDYKYCYVCSDGEVCFVEDLSEFQGSKTEEDWRIESWIPMN